jgi:hypothetical protein
MPGGIFSLVKKAVAVAEQSIITQNITPSSIADTGESATVEIQFKDANGKNCTYLGGQVLAASGDVLSPVSWDVVDNGDGTATATYTSSDQGATSYENALAVTLGGTAIGTINQLEVTSGGGCGC